MFDLEDLVAEAAQQWIALDLTALRRTIAWAESPAGDTQARLWMAHLNACEDPLLAQVCRQAIVESPAWDTLAVDLVRRLPCTPRTIAVLAGVLAARMPDHPLAALTADEDLNVAPVFDGPMGEADTILVRTPIQSSFSPGDAVFVGFEAPLETAGAVRIVSAEPGRLYLLHDVEHPLMKSGRAVIDPCILVQADRPELS